MKSRSYLIPVFLLLVLLSYPGFFVTAQQPPLQNTNAALESFIVAVADKHNLPGVVIAVTKGDEVAYSNAHGTAGGGRPLTPRTPMYIGSASKSFTGLAIAQLAERGLVDLNAPVRTYLPWFKVADEDASSRLTLNHFAHHVSGLSEAGYSFIPPDEMSITDAVRTLELASLTQPVGEQAQYFNLNYDVLAAVIESVTGQTYRQYVTENILQPLHMNNTYLSPEEAEADGLAQGYTRFLGFTVPARQPFREYDLPTGYIVSTAADMAHFVIAMNNGGRFKDDAVLSPEWTKRLFAPYPAQGFQYGIGWFIDTSYGFERRHHGGANETFKTHMALFPERDLGLVVMVNQGYLLDAYTSTAQLFAGIEQILLTGEQPDLSRGFSMRMFNLGFVVFFILLAAYQVWQLASLRTWRARAAQMSPRQRIWDISLNFIIPTVILIAVFAGLRSFFDYRFNLVRQVYGMANYLPDVMLLCLVGTLPDYLQGFAKLAMSLTRRVAQMA